MRSISVTVYIEYVYKWLSDMCSCFTYSFSFERMSDHNLGIFKRHTHRIVCRTESISIIRATFGQYRFESETK